MITPWHREDDQRKRTATSDLDDGGDEHRAAAVFAVDPAADGAADEMLEGVGVAGAVGEGLLDDLDEFGLDRVEGGRVVAEAAGGDLRAVDDLADLEVDGDEDRQEPVLPEDAAVLERGVADVADLEAVDVDV